MESTISSHFKRALIKEYRNTTSATFPEIGYKVAKKGKCNICGKNRQKTRLFYQTQSPWNTKSEIEIKEIEKEKANNWSKESFKCKCGGMVE